MRRRLTLRRKCVRFLDRDVRWWLAAAAAVADEQGTPVKIRDGPARCDRVFRVAILFPPLPLACADAVRRLLRQCLTKATCLSKATLESQKTYQRVTVERREGALGTVNRRSGLRY